jgi:hypothetical protein
MNRKAKLNLIILFFIYCSKNRLISPSQKLQIISKVLDNYFFELIQLINRSNRII